MFPLSTFRTSLLFTPKNLVSSYYNPQEYQLLHAGGCASAQATDAMFLGVSRMGGSKRRSTRGQASTDVLHWRRSLRTSLRLRSAKGPSISGRSAASRCVPRWDWFVVIKEESALLECCQGFPHELMDWIKCLWLKKCQWEWMRRCINPVRIKTLPWASVCRSSDLLSNSPPKQWFTIVFTSQNYSWVEWSDNKIICQGLLTWRTMCL